MLNFGNSVAPCQKPARQHGLRSSNEPSLTVGLLKSRASILLLTWLGSYCVPGDHSLLTKMIVKSVTMISWEFDPFRVRGGTAYAIRRLADQLTGLGIETRVILP